LLIAIVIGGLLARRSLAGRPVPLMFEEKELEIAFYSPIRTATIVKSDEWKRHVNEAGENALASLFQKKSWDGFVDASRGFALQSGLAGWCSADMEENSRASMAMLGQTLFSDAQLSLSRKPFKLLKAKTYKGGAELL